MAAMEVFSYGKPSPLVSCIRWKWCRRNGHGSRVMGHER